MNKDRFLLVIFPAFLLLVVGGKVFLPFFPRNRESLPLLSSRLVVWLSTDQATGHLYYSTGRFYNLTRRRPVAFITWPVVFFRLALFAVASLVRHSFSGNSLFIPLISSCLIHSTLLEWGSPSLSCPSPPWGIPSPWVGGGGTIFKKFSRNFKNFSKIFKKIFRNFSRVAILRKNFFS